MNTPPPPYFLIASFPTLEAAAKGINGYFYSTFIALSPSSPGHWRLSDTTGKERPAFRVRLYKRRYRFEQAEQRKDA